MILLYVLVFLIGASIGSFLNVVVFRFNTGKDVTGRSYCFSCGKSLSWFELIPIISFILQRGRCRTCKSKISFQYPLVELINGLIFLALYIKLLDMEVLSSIFIAQFIFFAVVFSFLLAISVYDLRHKIIPNMFVYIFIFLSIAYRIAVSSYTGKWMTTDFIIGPLLFIFFSSMWLVSRGKWMGLGDAKLSLGIGFLLGFSASFSAIVLSIWIASIVSIFLLLFSRKYFTLKSEIPLAPFLVLGTFVVFLSGFDVVNFVSNYSFIELLSS